MVSSSSCITSTEKEYSFPPSDKEILSISINQKIFDTCPQFLYQPPLAYQPPLPGVKSAGNEKYAYIVHHAPRRYLARSMVAHRRMACRKMENPRFPAPGKGRLRPQRDRIRKHPVRSPHRRIHQTAESKRRIARHHPGP